MENILPSKKLKSASIFISIFFFTLFLLLSPNIASFQGSVSAQTSATVNFQGKIVRRGTGVDGLNVANGDTSCVVGGADTCNFKASYFVASSGGTALWYEEFDDVEIGDYDGVFNLVLGSGTATGGTEASFEDVFLNNTSVYVEIEFDADGNDVFDQTFARMAVRAAPFAISANNIGGLTPDDFVQFRPSAVQVDSTTLSSVFINKTGASGNIIQLQKNGSDQFVVDNGGNVAVGGGTAEFKMTLLSDGGIIAKGTHGSGATLTTTGSGSRMFWYPRKSAFRAGRALSTDWNDANVGNFSVAFGDDTLASGIYSFAAGNQSNATNESSFALGYSNTSSGFSSFTANTGNTASGTSSAAFGSGTTAVGNYSFSFGLSSVANGDSSFAIGQSTDATGASSFASGSASDALGTVSAAFGTETIAGSSNSFVLGRYNIGGGTAGSWISTENLFEIGIGTSTVSRANAFTVLKNGQIGIGEATPTALLHINPATTGRSQLRLETSAGTNPSSPNSGDLWWNGTQLYFYNGSGSVNLLSSPGLSIGSTITSSTPGSVLFVGASNDLQQDNANFFFDNTNDRLGIRTSTPSQALDVLGSIELETTTSSTTGVVYKGADRFIHSFQHPTGDTAIPNGRNTFIGIESGNFTMGSTATSVGHGSYNTGIGYRVLYSNTTGYSNDGSGLNALYSNTIGYGNTSHGDSSMYFNTTGYRNTALGYNAGASTGVGQNSTSNTSLYLGADTKASVNGGSNEIVLGYNTTGFGSNSAAYGNSSITQHIFQSGNVGLDTTSPDYALEIGDSTLITGEQKKLAIWGFDESPATAKRLEIGVDTFGNGTFSGSIDSFLFKGDLRVETDSYLGFGNTSSGYFRMQQANSTSDDFEFLAGGNDVYRVHYSTYLFEFQQNVSIGVSPVTTSRLKIGANTTGISQINLTSSAGTNVSSPVNGDLWWNGTQLYFYNGSTNVNLLTGTTPTLSSVLTAGNTSGGTAIDMQNALITNIGNAGTDFTSGGGLTLAGNFTSSALSGFGTGTPTSNQTLTIGMNSSNADAYSIRNQLTLSGTNTANRTRFGIYNLVSTTALHGSFTETIYGSYNSIDGNGGVDITTAYGTYSNVNIDGTGFGGGSITTGYGSYSGFSSSSDETVSNGYGAYNTISNTSGTMTNAYGVYSNVSAGGGNITNAYGIYSNVVSLGDIANSYGVYVANSTGLTSAYGIYVATNANNYFAGNVGIGTSTPGHMLSVLRSQNATTRVELGNYDTGTSAHTIFRMQNSATAADGGGLFLGGPNFTANSWGDSLVLSADSGISGGVKIYAQTGGIKLSSSTHNNALFVATNDRIGVGTSSPGSTVDVLAATPVITLRNTSSNQVESGRIRFLEIDAGAYFDILHNGSTNMLHFYSSNTADNVMSLDRVNARVGIGTSSPSALFHTVGAVRMQSLPTSGDDRYICGVSSTGALVMKNAVCTTSSQVFKENIVTIESATDAISQLRPVYFNYLTDSDLPSDGSIRDGRTKRRMGFIAEEINALYPEVVYYDELGAPNSVNYADLTALAIRGIQEQQVLIVDLQSQIDALGTMSTSVNDFEVLGTLNGNIINANSVNLQNLNSLSIVSQSLQTDTASVRVLSAYSGESLAIKLGDISGGTSLNITNSDGMAVFGISSTGKITINDQGVDASVGTGTIVAGVQETTILTDAVTADSKIFLTAKSTSTGELPVVVTVEIIDIAPNKGFVVKTDLIRVEDVQFDWWIIN